MIHDDNHIIFLEFLGDGMKETQKKTIHPNHGREEVLTSHNSPAL